MEMMLAALSVIWGGVADRHPRLRIAFLESGGGWMAPWLDRTDRLAARLARGGESEAIHLEETDTTFAVGWKGRYEIKGPAFVYSDHETGAITTILGYPTEKLSLVA